MSGALFMGSDTGDGFFWIEENVFGHDLLSRTVLAGLTMDEAVQMYAARNPKMLVSIEDHCPWDES